MTETKKPKKISQHQAARLCLNFYKRAVNNWVVKDYIETNGYHDFSDSDRPDVTVAARLMNLFIKDDKIRKDTGVKKGVNRIKKPPGTGIGYVYYLEEYGIGEILIKTKKDFIVVEKKTAKKPVEKKTAKKPISQHQAALLCLNKYKRGVNNWVVKDYIESNGYYDFSSSNRGEVTVSRVLMDLFVKDEKLRKETNNKKGVNRIKKPDGRGFVYYLNDFGVGEILIKSKKDFIKPKIVEPTPKIATPKIVEPIINPSFDKGLLEEKFKEFTGLEFNAFYKKYRPKLVWYLTRYTRDQEIAEDFADDAFTQSLLKIDNYNKDKSQIHTWIYKIAENLVKKDYKDQQKMSVVSLDKENSENLNLINIIPNGHLEDRNIMEEDSILIKKAELVKRAIYQLPDKYKRVMILREIENRPYIDIAEMCVKRLDLELNNEERNLPTAVDFIYLKIVSRSNATSYINITYNEGDENTIQFEIEPFKDFKIERGEIGNISAFEIISNGICNVKYKMTTNLSTIKSQISKGRQLIQSMVNKKFKILEDQGLPMGESFNLKKKDFDIFEGDKTFEQEDDWF